MKWKSKEEMKWKSIERDGIIEGNVIAFAKLYVITDVFSRYFYRIISSTAKLIN